MDLKFERDDWAAVCGAASLAPGTVIPATLHDNDIAVWRGESGEVHAWHSQCPHRGMRLSAGFVRGERLGCLYHGWQYGGSGQCEHIPAHPDLEPPKTVCATTYHAEESAGLIWVSLSDAPEPLTGIGDLHFCTSIFVGKSAARVVEALPSVQFTPFAGKGADNTVSYRANTLSASAARITATRGDVEESVVLVVQPMTESRAGIHVVTDAGDTTAGRLHYARWARCLRWSLENSDTGTMRGRAA